MRRHPALDGTVLCVRTFGLEGFTAFMAVNVRHRFRFVVKGGLTGFSTETPRPGLGSVAGSVEPADRF